MGDLTNYKLNINVEYSTHKSGVKEKVGSSVISLYKKAREAAIIVVVEIVVTMEIREKRSGITKKARRGKESEKKCLKKRVNSCHCYRMKNTTEQMCATNVNTVNGKALVFWWSVKN